MNQDPAATANTDEALLAAFLDGDETSFTLIVRRYQGDLFQFVARFVGDSATAEDVVQDTFVQVHHSAAGFDPQRRFRPWLFTIAANKARDYLRSRGRRKEVALMSTNDDDESNGVLAVLSDDGPSPVERLHAAEQADRVRAVVAELPDHLREVLLLGYYQRLPYKEIADILDIPLGTVKSRLHAAVSKFADLYRKATAESSEPSVGSDS